MQHGGRESQSEARQVCGAKSASVMAAGETGRSFCGGRQSSASRDASATQVRPPLIGRLPVASPYCFFQFPSEYTQR